jgi:DNA-binding beta-propeller fold protein YncE
LLAQRTSTPAVNALVTRLHHLSRDVTVTDGSPRDPTGGHGLTIAIDRRVQWPYRWYFRDYPDAVVVANGQAPESGAQVVIAPDDAGMAEAGYTPRSYPTLNRVPAVYTAPEMSTILKSIFFPGYWSQGVDFLILRDLAVKAPPETIAVGLNAELANRVFPNTGPFGLFDRAGTGSGRGQFDGPRGIAVAPDTGTTYVVDMGNARVERFDDLGQFIGAWGAEDGGVAFERTDAGLGPTGIAVSADGQTIYVCDTWNHRIVVLDQTGQMVREIGSFKDTEDSPDPMINTGFFFGPRDVAVTDDEIYVVDTGNERVQVFGLDGTFKRAFGGFGSEPGQLIEPVGIALGPDGRVYVADSGNARIAIFASDGTPLEQWPVDAWVGQKYFEPYLTFDPEGNLYATSSATGSIEVFDPTGQLIDSIEEIGSEGLQGPIGITLAPDGSILITDARRNAVLRYTAPAPSLIPDPGEIIDEIPASPDAATPDASPEAPVDANAAASPAASPIASPIARRETT